MSYDIHRLRCIISELIDRRDSSDSDAIFFDNIVWISAVFLEEERNPESEYRYFVSHQTHAIRKSQFFKTRRRDITAWLPITSTGLTTIQTHRHTPPNTDPGGARP